MMSKRMSPYVAVFNCHINNAEKRANLDVIAKFGRALFFRVFPKIYRDGVMSIFHNPETPEKRYWVARCTRYANEKATP